MNMRPLSTLLILISLTACVSQQQRMDLARLTEKTTRVPAQNNSIAEDDFVAAQIDSAPKLTLVKALAYCETKGQRLPTPREMFHWAIRYGATGIKETQFPNDRLVGENAPTGDSPKAVALRNEEEKMGRIHYLPVQSFKKLDGTFAALPADDFSPTNIAGNFVEFYYNSTGYQAPDYLYKNGIISSLRPSGSTEKPWVWTSSITYINMQGANMFGFHFASFLRGHAGNVTATICVPK